MPVTYRIRVKAHIDSTWSAWFGGLSITHESNGDSVLSGKIIDQADLFGILTKVHDLNLELLSVCQGDNESRT